MGLRKYRDLIETFEFGAQFSIFSGFSLVLAAMEENETLNQLVGELRSSKIWRKALLNLVKVLLRSENTDSQMAFDGCVAAYLYCMWKADLKTGFAASRIILKTPDLWWSAKLALLVRKEYLDDQLSTSVTFQSLRVEPHLYTLHGRESVSYEGLDRLDSLLHAVRTALKTSHRYDYKPYVADTIQRKNVAAIILEEKTRIRGCLKSNSRGSDVDGQLGMRNETRMVCDLSQPT